MGLVAGTENCRQFTGDNESFAEHNAGRERAYSWPRKKNIDKWRIDLRTDEAMMGVVSTATDCVVYYRCSGHSPAIEEKYKVNYK